MNLPRALLFDVDGTLADTEAAHRDAFNEAFAAEQLDWYWSTPLYTRLLSVSGGKERIAAYATLRAEVLPAEAIDRLHADKTRRYTAKVAGGRVPLRPGVARLLDEARAAGIPLAIATTTTPANIDALLGATLGPGWRARFAAVGDAATSTRKKPHPDVYRHVLEQLALPGAGCLAFEDSGNGVRAARAAGVDVVVTPTSFTAADDFHGALCVLPDLGRLRLADLGSLRGAGSAIITPEAESEPCPDRT